MKVARGKTPAVAGHLAARDAQLAPVASVCHRDPARPKVPRESTVSDAQRPATPQKAIRLHCLGCAETTAVVTRCPAGPGTHDPCSLYQFRRGPGHKAGRGSRLKSIRAHCLWCMCGSFKEARDCEATKCTLWLYRFGKRPKLA